MDIRVRVNGGGHVAQIYAIRQAISKALVAYYQKCKLYIKKFNIIYIYFNFKTFHKKINYFYEIFFFRC